MKNMTIYLNYPKYYTQLLSNKGNLGSIGPINYNRQYNSKNAINSNDAWKLSYNNVGRIYKPKTTIIPKNKSNIYGSYNPYISSINSDISNITKK